MFRSVVLQLAGSLVCALVSFLLVVYLGRVLGTEGFGHYAALLSAAVVALPLIEGGWSPHLYRSSVAADGADRTSTLPGLATTHVLASCLVLTLLGAGFAIASGWAGPLPVAAALGCMGAVALTNLVSARMRGQDRFGLEAGWRVAGRVASAVAIVLAMAWFDRSVANVFLAWAAGLALVLSLGGGRWLERPRRDGLRQAYPVLLPLMLMELFFALLLRGDVAIAAISGLDHEPLSFYAACARLLEVAVLLFSPYTNVLLRRLRLLHADAPAYSRVLMRALWLGAGSGAAAVLLAMIAGPALLPALFGEGFAAAGALMPWVALCLPAMLANQILVQGIVALQRERALPARLALAGLLCCASVAIGVQLDGARGAAIGFAIAQLGVCVLLRPLAQPVRP